MDLKRNRGENFSIKQLEKSKKSVKQKLEKLNDQSRKDDGVICARRRGGGCRRRRGWCRCTRSRRVPGSGAWGGYCLLYTSAAKIKDHILLGELILPHGRLSVSLALLGHQWPAGSNR